LINSYHFDTLRAERKPVMNIPRGRIRYSVDLPVQMDDKTEALANKRGVKKAEILRRSLELLNVLDEKIDQGYKIGAWKRHDDGTLEFVEIVF
jgi:hypothetical protein